MIKNDMIRLQITIPKFLKKELDIRVEQERRNGYATKSTLIQDALLFYLKQKK